MKFRRCMTAICSSALVLGLSFLLYPDTKATNVDELSPTAVITPTAVPGSTQPVSTPIANNSTQTLPNATPSPTEAVEDTLPPLLTGNTLTKPLSAITDLVTAYIDAYYSNDFETVSSLVTDAAFLNPSLIEKNAANIKEVTDIELYAKPGIDGVFSIVYATYSLYYNDLQLSVPQFSEYYIKRLSDGTYRIQTAPLSVETKQAFLKARQSEAVQKLAIASLIKRYHCACLAANEPLLTQCVTDADYLNLDYITSRYSVTESFSGYEFLLYPGINEFEYIVFVTHNEKIVFSETPAPCIESYYIDIDSASGLPLIYLGVTSLDTDAYCKALEQSDEIQALAAQVNQNMQDALLADDDLNEFYQRLRSNTSEQ